MSTNHWFYNSSLSANSQLSCNDNCGEPKANNQNMEVMQQHIASSTISTQNNVSGSNRNVRDPRLSNRNVRDPRLRKSNPTVLNQFPSNQAPDVNQSSQGNQKTFLPFLGSGKEKLTNINLDDPKGLDLTQAYNQFLQEISQNSNGLKRPKSLDLTQACNQFLQEISQNNNGLKNPSWLLSGGRYHSKNKNLTASSASVSVGRSAEPDQEVSQNYRLETPNSRFSGGSCANKTENLAVTGAPLSTRKSIEGDQEISQDYRLENPNWHVPGGSYSVKTENPSVTTGPLSGRSSEPDQIVPNYIKQFLPSSVNYSEMNSGTNGTNFASNQNEPYKMPQCYSQDLQNQLPHPMNAVKYMKVNENVSKATAIRNQEGNLCNKNFENGYTTAAKFDYCSGSYSASSVDSCYNKSTEYDSSRSRIWNSHSRGRNGRSQSRNEGRSYSSRCKSRSRSRSRQRKYRSRSRSTSRSRSRYRYGSRSRSRSRSKSRYRSRSRSRSRSASRSVRTGSSSSSRSYSYSRRERNHDRDGCSRSSHNESRPDSQRLKLIEKWRMNNCDTQDEMHKRLEEICQMNPDEILEEENKIWIRTAPADCFYERDPSDLRRMRGTSRLVKLCERFRYELLDRGNRIRQTQNLKCPSPPKPKQKLCRHKSQVCSSSDKSDSESDESDDVNDMIEELQRKQKHPYRLHPELWYNDPGEMNDGPLCRCSAKARRSGIRHGFYAGENQRSYCDKNSNNAGSLYHYRITISPPTNFLTRTPTIINYDDHEFIFEGFSLISHYPIQKLPTCKVIRFNIEYIILYVEEKLPENFCIEELDLFYNYLFKEILELVDFELSSSEFPDSCPQFHFMPRFVRELPDNGKELLPMCEILKYMLDSNKKVIEDDALDNIHKMSNSDWQNFADLVKGMVVTNPGMKPSSLRVDQIDRDTDESIKRSNGIGAHRYYDWKKNNLNDRSSLEKDSKRPPSPPSVMKVEENTPDEDNKTPENPQMKLNTEDDTRQACDESDSLRDKLYPEIVHFGIRPPQLSYAGNPEYQKAWRNYVKFRHLLANMPKPTAEDKQKLAAKENCLHSMRAHSKMKRDVTVTVSSKGFYMTGLMCDVVQHAMLIPVLVCHLRFHRSLVVLEEKIGYKFKNRFLLQLALTHPSYRENFGTNSDHARNSLTNCGIRQPQYGDRRIHYMNTRKRGINTLISIMSRFGKKNETQSNIYHNERLEFLGDAVVEFITSIHLFHIFRDLEEGGLATYRAALVQNQHLAVLAKKLHLDEFMLYAHGSDLCHDLEQKHAMANCFEALMGALFLDGGIEAADHVFGNTLYGDEEDCLDVWFNYPPHPLQEQEPLGDRKWISQFPLLQKLTEFEEATGIEFKHIRLLARAFTDRSVGYTNLTLGSNQRLEFLGDSVLQLIASEYLYKYFPEHHEGHLSLLRSSLVNNKTQSVVSDDLGMTKYAVYASPKVELKIKDRADLLEAFLGALYVDNGLEICRVFCDVCFFPRLQVFIMNQDWNDPKSKLQQCCLTLRTIDNSEPDIPVYKVVECKGPTNTRVYTVAVYFRNKRLAKATGHSIQQAEMNAAQKAMENSGPLFPQLDHQKRVIAKSLKTQKWPNRSSWTSESLKEPDKS